MEKFEDKFMSCVSEGFIKFQLQRKLHRKLKNLSDTNKVIFKH